MDIPISVVSKIAEYAVAPIGRQMGYLFSYDRNFEELSYQAVELNIAREDIKRLVEVEEREGREILLGVKSWLDKVDKITNDARQLCEDPRHKMVGCTKYPFTSLWRRHQLSRNAEKVAKNIAALQVEGMPLRNKIGYVPAIDEAGSSSATSKIAYVPAIDEAGSTSATSHFVNFESRMSIMNEIMKALGDPKLSRLGVYGFGGVGKTTLVKQIAEKAELDNLFEKVVRASVTQSSDLRGIQSEIIEKLGLPFTKKTTACRADLLRKWLTEGKNILIILDNILTRIELEDIGIPYGGKINLEARKLPSQDDQKGCKVLMTSRNEDVLHKMETQKNFRLEVLNEKETWNLFEAKVGDIAKDCTHEGIGRDVAKKCAGLPILVVTVARTLKSKGIRVWKDALSKLARAENEELSKIINSALSLSYNELKDAEVKAIFLLFGVIQSRDVEYLLKCAMGLGIFKNTNTVEDARNRLYTVISALKASCLLLDDGDTSVKLEMHDVVRDVAVSIALKHGYIFVTKQNFELKEWPTNDIFRKCSSIILHECNIEKLPERLDCPELEFFSLAMGNNRSLKIPDSFFEGMGKLKVLDLRCMEVSSLPASVCYLTELQTLCLDECALGDIAGIGALKNLKVLSLHSSSMVELPNEMGQLTKLRMLDMTNSEIAVIPPNIMSSLTTLEELYMGSASIKWEVAELRQLPSLSALVIKIGEVGNLPRDLSFDKLERFNIVIGNVWVWEWTDYYGTSNTLKLKLPIGIQMEHGIEALTKRVESLWLDEINGISNVLYQLNGEGFPLLKHLDIQNNTQIQHIINSMGWNEAYDSFPSLETLELQNLSKLETLSHGPLSVNSLSKLKVIKVKSCQQLKYLFSDSMVERLSQLVDVVVEECNSMQVVVLEENSSVGDNIVTDTIKFCQLRSLTLQKLPTLDGFFSDEFTKVNDKRLATTSISNPFFNRKHKEL